MSQETDRYPLPPDDPRQLAEQIRDLQRQIDELKGRNPMAAGATVRDGLLSFTDASGIELLRISADGMTIFDAAGNPQIRAGALQSGGYGLEAINALGQAVTLASLGFGIQANAVATAQSPASTGSYVDLATVGPSVTVTVGESGRVLLIAGARILAFSNDDGFLGYTLSGANTLAATKITTLENGNTGGLISASTAGFEMLTGLDPGATTVTLKYRSTSTLNQFAERVVIAFPL